MTIEIGENLSVLLILVVIMGFSTLVLWMINR